MEIFDRNSCEEIMQSHNITVDLTTLCAGGGFAGVCQVGLKDLLGIIEFPCLRVTVGVHLLCITRVFTPLLGLSVTGCHLMLAPAGR